MSKGILNAKGGGATARLIVAAAFLAVSVLSAGVARADRDAWTLISGQEIDFRDIVLRTGVRGQGMYQGYRFQLLLPPGAETPEQYVHIADDIFEEYFGPFVTASEGGRATISFGNNQSGRGEDWISRDREVTYLRQNNGRWRRSSHRSVVRGESTLSQYDDTELIELANGTTINVHPYRKFTPFGSGEPILEVRYESDTPAAEYGQSIVNSLLYWRTIVALAPEAETVNFVRIYARKESRSDRFDFPCGVRVDLLRDNNSGQWPETAGLPIEIGVSEFTGRIIQARTPAGGSVQIASDCRY